jgi:hypothetical protein
MIPLRLLGIGLVGPGLNGWQASIPLLENRGAGYRWEETIIPPVSTLLPANARRRITPTIKLALAAAEQAADDAVIQPNELATVFASSHGDMRVSDNLCRALAAEGKPVSPTQFHNSVHNAPAGYWSIATGSRYASTSLAVADASFPAALLETALQSQTTGRPVMLVTYDYPAPFPLSSVASLAAAFAVAMVVQADGNNPGLTLTLSTGESTTLENPKLERIRLGNPAARVLPLLHAIADRKTARITLPYFDRQLAIDVAAV